MERICDAVLLELSSEYRLPPLIKDSEEARNFLLKSMALTILHTEELLCNPDLEKFKEEY